MTLCTSVDVNAVQFRSRALSTVSKKVSLCSTILRSEATRIMQYVLLINCGNDGVRETSYVMIVWKLSRKKVFVSQ